MQARVAKGLFDQRLDVFVVPMPAIRGESIGPLSRKVTNG